MLRYLLILAISLKTMSSIAQSRDINYFISQAIANSPMLKDLQNQVKQNQLDSLIIVAAQRPQVAFKSDNNYAPVINGYGYDEAITNGANINALLSVNKSLLNNRTNKIQFANLKQLSDALRNNMVISEQDLKKAIISQYITTYGDWLQVSLISGLQYKLKKQDTILKKLTEKNVYRQVDYLAFYISLQQNEFKLKQQVNQYKNDYFTLNYLAGIADTSQPLLERPDISLNELPDIIESPFFKKFQLDSLGLVVSKAMIDIAYKPKLNVFADAGYMSSLAYRPYRNFGASIGFSLLVPIYDGKQKRLQYKKVEVRENTRLANRQFYYNQYQQQVAQLKQQLQATADLEKDINTQLKFIETLVVANEKLLQTGDVRIYDYIIALNNYLNAQSLVNDNTINRWQLINQVNYWNR